MYLPLKISHLTFGLHETNKTSGRELHRVPVTVHRIHSLRAVIHPRVFFIQQELRVNMC